jgi:hypothetical protein
LSSNPSETIQAGTYFCRNLFSSGSGEVVQGEHGEKGAMNVGMIDTCCDGFGRDCLAPFNIGLVIVANFSYLRLRPFVTTCEVVRQMHAGETLRPVMVEDKPSWSTENSFF